MSNIEFIEKISELVCEICPKYNINACAAVVAQACLESGFGTSYKAKHHNYFGLKYREGRLTVAHTKFTDVGSEQNSDGSYSQITTEWFEFENMRDCIEGYCQFLGISRYNNIKNISDSRTYLQTLKDDGYASSHKYVTNLMRVVNSYNLEQICSKYYKPVNSPLATVIILSPNCNKPRNHAIDTITIHCMAGDMSVESCGNMFAKPERNASSNYGVGSDGRVALYVSETDRSWCSSNRENDNRAITIEVASSNKHPYEVTDAALESTIKLVADICKRNNITKLVWSNSKEERVNHLNGCNMTVHRDFAAKACPGDYLYERHQYIADEVNKLLGVDTPVIKPESNVLYRVQCGVFRNKANAEALVARLKAAGFNAIIKEDFNV